MPFTFAHPAAVLPFSPLLAKRYSMSGMIAGSMVPDFEYFFRMEVKSLYSHSLPGIFLLDIPVALLLTVLFHCLIRNALINNLPDFLYRRLSHLSRLNWLAYMKCHKATLILSIMFGILSHLLWDSFTHQGAFLVEYFNYSLVTLDLFHISAPLYKVLQHISTIVGGLVICSYILLMPKSEQTQPDISLRYWLAVAYLFVAILTTRMIFIYPNCSLGVVIVTSLSALMIALVIAPLVLKIKSAA